MAQTNYDVFISYSRKDYVDEHKNVISGNVVSIIKDALTEAGITYWFDEDGIYSGDEFGKIIVRNIRNAKLFVFLSTTNSNQSVWTSREIKLADELKKKIIPVRIDNSMYNDDFYLLLVCLSHIDYYVNPNKGRHELIRSIKAYLDAYKEDDVKTEAKGFMCHEKNEDQPITQENKRCTSEKGSQSRTDNLTNGIIASGFPNIDLINKYHLGSIIDSIEINNALGVKLVTRNDYINALLEYVDKMVLQDKVIELAIVFINYLFDTIQDKYIEAGVVSKQTRSFDWDYMEKSIKTDLVSNAVNSSAIIGIIGHHISEQNNAYPDIFIKKLVNVISILAFYNRRIGEYFDGIIGSISDLCNLTAIEMEEVLKKI